ncbi:MAG TPA: hypothetical protein VGC42_23385, partial [Kofleriaceae bacterium]
MISLANARGTIGNSVAALRVPRVSGIVVASFLARLPKGMVPLAIVLLLNAQFGGYGAAGATAAALTLGDGLTSPLQGRLIDRFGRAQVMLPSLVGYCLSLVALVLLARATAPPTVLAIVAFVAGATYPPVSGSVKAVWPLVVEDPRLLPAVYALESLCQHLFFLAGPLISITVMMMASPTIAILAAAGFSILGTLGYVAQTSGYVTLSARALGGAGAWSSAALRAMAVATFAQGVVFGVLVVALPALAAAEGHRPWAGPLVAA